MGVLVGVAITLLFTTKKGREIFKDTLDRALDKFSDLQNKIDEDVVYDDEDDGSDYVKQTPAPKEKAPEKPEKKEVRYLASETKEEVIEDEPLAEEPEIEESEEIEELPKAAKPKTEPEERKEEPKVIPFESEESEPEAPKKASPVRKFFKLKKR